MNTHTAMPHSPDISLFSEDELSRLTIDAQECSRLLQQYKQAVKVRDDLSRKNEEDTSLLASAREGKISKKGKTVLNPSAVDITEGIREAEGAAIFGKGKLREASEEVGRTSQEILSFKTNFGDRWRPIISDLKQKEEQAWHALAQCHFNPRSPMFRNASEMWKSSYVEAALEQMERNLGQLRMSSSSNETIVSQVLAIIERMKGAPKS